MEEIKLSVVLNVTLMRHLQIRSIELKLEFA